MEENGKLMPATSKLKYLNSAKEVMSVCLRSVGDLTMELTYYFKEASAPTNVATVPRNLSTASTKFMSIRITAILYAANYFFLLL